jgi:predicted dehydrogenase
VGLIGANPDKGWGSAVHIPVIRHLPGFRLCAVATTHEDSARRSAERSAVPHAFADPRQLVEHPEVDLVVIAVKAPDHRKLAMMALDAGKHVYCEWPLAANTAQAEQMAARAAQKNVRAMVGLQARGAPALRHARNLIHDGFVGRIVSVRLNCALPGGGRRRSREGLYVIDKANGASTLAIQGGHGIDALRFCVGELTGLTALVANQFPEIEIIETGERLAKDAPDQIFVAGRIEGGAVASVAINGGVVAGHGIAIDIFGEAGTLSIGWPGGLNFQMSELILSGARESDRALSPIAVPEDGKSPIPADIRGGEPYPGVRVPRATLVNLANLYLDLEMAIGQGRDPSPGFGTGVTLHRLLDRIVAASGSEHPTALAIA